MVDTLLYLNSEWQGCKNPVLETGSRKLAKDIFGEEQFIDIGPSDPDIPETVDGVFALGPISNRFARVLEFLRDRRPLRIVTIGGSCGTEAAPVAYLNELYKGRIGVVWLDAHGDLNTPESSPSGHFHGMVLRTLLGEGPNQFVRHLNAPLLPEQVILVGIRDLDEAERHYIQKENINVVPGWEPLASERVIRAISSIGVKQIYVHIDLDVLNPDSFQNSLMPVPGGPTLEELGECLQMISSAFDVVGLSVVEYCGRVDGSESQIPMLLEEGGIALRVN
jgi:arginase